jgi:hypothetical protein
VEVVRLAGTPARAEVRSNSELAVAAVATAFAQESITHAWVQADFGGGASTSGAAEDRYRDSVLLPGAPPAASPPATRVADPSAGTRAVDSVAAARAAARERERQLAREQQARLRLAERARLDSVSKARAAARLADSLAFAARRAAARRPAPASSPVGPPVPASRSVGPAPRPRADSVAARRVPEPSVRVTRADTSRASAPVSDGPERVKRIEAFTEPVATSAPDTCACRLRGTVEVVWPRPLEEGLPIQIAFEGPAIQRAEVTLDMGAPREFRLGPLPCGDYLLRVRPEGRLHYELPRGGDSLRVSCRGLSQVRLVLRPSK